MPSFMPIGPKLWSGEGFLYIGYIHTYKLIPLMDPLIDGRSFDLKYRRKNEKKNVVLIYIVIVFFRFHHQALVEVKILDALRRKDKDNQFNIIHMSEYFYFRNHLCITFELMG